MTSRKINQLWFRSVPQNTNTSVDIGNLRNGTKRNGRNENKI